MTTNSPTLVIVGGVAGGASAATRARRMNENARIVMFEKDEHVSFANCGLPYRVGGEIDESGRLLVAKPETIVQRFGIDVRTRQEVTSIDRAHKRVQVTDRRTGRSYSQPYDKLILAPGAIPIVPPVPGATLRGVFTLRTIGDADRIVAALPAARRAAVIGGGFIGLEIVEQFRRRGLEVSLVELQPQVLPVLDPEMAEPLHREIESNGVRLLLGRGIAAVEETDGAAVAVRLSDGTRVAADIVLLGLGVRPNVTLASACGVALGTSGGIATDEHMRTSDPDIYAVGDAAEHEYGPTGAHTRVALAGPANRTGRLAGEHAVRGDAAAAPRAWGTAVVRVFGKVAGTTGLSLRAALRAGIDARAVHVVANHHAGWFPGAEPMILKLVYRAGDGLVLGAQAVGGAGVDKRLDVIATTLHHRGTVHDLAQIDLAYAPPFGSAKDPLHFAAFAAENDLAGLARLLPPDADLSAFQVVDVRSADEIARLPLANAPGAANIPLEELRARLGELDPSRTTVVSCQTGLRAHVAARMLSQHGFRDVYNLSGAATVRDLTVRRAAPATRPPACRAPTTAACGGPRSPTVSDPETISPADFASVLETGTADVLDVRTGAEFRAVRVRGARNVPLDALTSEAAAAGRAGGAGGPTYLLCKSGGRARMAATRLRAAGVACVVVDGGTDACVRAGLPVERDAGAATWSLERQVRLIAGLLVLTGVALGAFVHPAGYGLAAFVGAGLTFAGATDICGMAFVLGRCPWNR